MTVPDLRGAATRHWFYLLLPLWLAASLNLHLGFPWRAEPQVGEAIALVDWCVFVPALYVLCYRGRIGGWALALKASGLACFGLWLAGRIVPDPAEDILRSWSWLRYPGMAVFAALELVATVSIIRIAFADRASPDNLVRKGVPPMLARLMLLEARFWRWAWGRLRRR